MYTIKKSFFSIFILILLFSGCASITRVTEEVEKKLASEGGFWMNNDTYLVYATGLAQKELSDQKERRLSSKIDSILFAQQWVLDRFYRIWINLKTGIPEDYSVLEISLIKELVAMGLVNGIENGHISMPKNYRILKETYDTDDNCKLIVEVRYKGLRNKIKECP